jgi:hypothetical protein
MSNEQDGGPHPKSRGPKCVERVIGLQPETCECAESRERIVKRLERTRIRTGGRSPMNVSKYLLSWRLSIGKTYVEPLNRDMFYHSSYLFLFLSSSHSPPTPTVPWLRYFPARSHLYVDQAPPSQPYEVSQLGPMPNGETMLFREDERNACSGCMLLERETSGHSFWRGRGR